MILQLGTGAFLRGFLDWILFERGYDRPVIASGLTRGGGAALLRARGGTFTHAVEGASFRNTVLDEVLDPYEEWERLREVAADPSLEWIVTNGTEAGMTWREAPAPEPCPEPFAAKLAALLLARFRASPAAELLVTPTELVEDNGRRLRELVRAHARAWEAPSEFDGWLDDRVRFVGTLVDRIVSGAPTTDDPLAIASERYLLWVLERPEGLRDVLDVGALNVHGVDDLTPWRERKVRVLNGGHACLVFPGLLLGLEHVHEGMEHAALGPFVRRCLAEEVLPTLAGERAELEAYLDDVLARFENAWLRHRLDAIRLNSHAKVRARLLPAMRDHAARTGALPPGLTTALAAFLLVYREATDGDEVEVLARHHAGWREGGAAGVLADLVLFPPEELAGLEGLAEEVEGRVAALERDLVGGLEEG